MKTNVLTFLAGIALGAALLKVTDGLISSPDHNAENDGRDSPSISSRQKSGGGSGRSGGLSRSPGSSSYGNVKQDNASLLDQIADLRSAGDLEVSTLEIGRIIADIGALSLEETHAFLLEIGQLEEHEDWYDPLDEIAMTAALRLIELEGLDAIHAIENDRYPEFSARYAEDFGIPMISFWTSHDSDAARDWFLSNMNLNSDARSLLAGQLEDEDVVETFFLSYERQRPGQGLALVPNAGSEEQKELFLEHALHARINLADQSTNLPGVLDQSLALKDLDAFESLLESAFEKDWESSKQWVEELEPSPQRDRSVITVGNSLINQQDSDQEEALEWLMSQEIDDHSLRMNRLSLVQQGLTPSLNSDFISPVDRVHIPGIPDSPHDTVVFDSVTVSGGTIISRNSIDAILNNPLRISGAVVDPAQMAESLRKTAEENYDGRFADFVNSEIQELGLEQSAPELPNKSPENQPPPTVGD